MKNLFHAHRGLKRTHTCAHAHIHTLELLNYTATKFLNKVYLYVASIKNQLQVPELSDSTTYTMKVKQ